MTFGIVSSYYPDVIDWNVSDSRVLTMFQTKRMKVVMNSTRNWTSTLMSMQLILKSKLSLVSPVLSRKSVLDSL